MHQIFEKVYVQVRKRSACLNVIVNVFKRDCQPSLDKKKYQKKIIKCDKISLLCR